ncbi:class I SAM-dependent methyltransferase [Tuwongella immobilis]|nr:methyltransferase [Tuwongella immobilis]
MKILPLLELARPRLQFPLCIILGSPRPVADLVQACAEHGPITCYQMDLFQAQRLQAELDARNVQATIQTLPDLWDLTETFAAAIYPMQTMGERELKLDMLEQAFHILKPDGILLTLSETNPEILCPKWHKKIYGKVSIAPAIDEGTVLWSYRTGERERRRHELNFHARVGDFPSMNFRSRPGVFTYGDMDHGARALVEVADIGPGMRVLDLGCGTGTNGCIAWQRCGPDGAVTFLDSNVRAIALAEQNAQANGLTQFRAIASPQFDGIGSGSIDVVLANPPYHANLSIARQFIEASRPLLAVGGRFYLVTKTPNKVAPMVEEVFGEVITDHRRGYAVLSALA